MVKIMAEGEINSNPIIINTRMRQLTENQVIFLLSFFENNEYAGWKSLATRLIKNGSCIVAGNHNIWVGGIGNFIKTYKNDNFIDCLEYTFNLEEFLNSAWYKENAEIYRIELINARDKFHQKLLDIDKLK